MAKNRVAHHAIQFGTDGWRAEMGEGFTFENVRRVASAIAEYVRQDGEPGRGLLVGYDTRFLSPEAAEVAAEAVAARGVPVTLAGRPTPTPAVSYAVVERKSAGALVITASHNPSRWNGIKFKAPYGGSALPSIMQRIEFHLDQLDGPDRAPRRLRRAPRQTADLVAPYLARLRSIVDFGAIGRSGRRFVVVGSATGAGKGGGARANRKTTGSLVVRARRALSGCARTPSPSDSIPSVQAFLPNGDRGGSHPPGRTGSARRLAA